MPRKKVESKSISFDCTKREGDLANIAAQRALKRLSVTTGVDLRHIEMDLLATHANGNKLDFEKLLTFSDVDFFHDVSGIHRHLDRITGKLQNLFVPRCTKKSQTQKAEVGGH